MSRSSHSALIYRLLLTCVASLIVGVILLRPVSSYFLQEDAEAMEISLEVEENDVEEETLTEIDEDYFLSTYALDKTAALDEQSREFFSQCSPTSTYSEVFLPPPEL